MRGSMQLALTLVSPTPDAAQAAIGPITTALAGARARVKEPRVLGPGAVDLALEAIAIAPVRIAVARALEGLPIDACVQHWNGRRKRLLIADMDSTIINVECIDELADFAGVKAEVSAITSHEVTACAADRCAQQRPITIVQGHWQVELNGGNQLDAFHEIGRAHV